jgi:arylsulfatase
LLWLKELESYLTYPPLQAAETYNLGQVIAEIKKAHESHPSLVRPLRAREGHF